MLWDTHMHTHFSGDSSASTESMIQAAKKAGLAGICLTDHLDLDYPERPDYFSLDLDGYQKETDFFSKKYAGEIDIRLGIEIGLQPHLAAQLNQTVTEYPFDFVIGSSHVVHGIDPYYPQYYRQKTEEEAYREYFCSILENIMAYDNFDVYGHIDYVVRYGPNKNKYYSYLKFQDIIDEILKALIVRGKGIEINTGGFKYGLGHPNPTEEIIKRYHQLGGEIITIGSDAHAPEHVAYDFNKIPEILKACGFCYYSVFQNRTCHFLPL